MTAEIIWDFAAKRHAQIEAEKNEVAAEMLAFCLEGAPSGYYPTWGGDADLIYYVSPSSNVELPSDSEPA